MKKYLMVTPETLNKLGNCFSNSDEAVTFISQMDDLVDELGFCVEMRKRIQDDQSAMVLLKQVCVFTIFCREHMDLVHQLVNNIECKEITEDEMKEMTDS